MLAAAASYSGLVVVAEGEGVAGDAVEEMCARMSRHREGKAWLTLAGCLSAMLLLLVAVLGPVFRGARSGLPSSQCLWHMRDLAGAQLAYAEDHDGRLPAASAWMDSIAPDLRNDDCLRCPKSRWGRGTATQ